VEQPRKGKKGKLANFKRKVSTMLVVWFAVHRLPGLRLAEPQGRVHKLDDRWDAGDGDDGVHRPEGAEASVGPESDGADRGARPK